VTMLVNSIFATGASGRSYSHRTQAQAPPRIRNTSKSIVEFDLTYEIFASDGTRRVNFLLLIPKTLPNRQRILSTKYSIEPSRVFNKNGNRYAEFVLNNPQKRTDIVVSIRAELFRYDLETARRMRIKNTSKGPGFRDFLKREKYIEKDDPQIQEVADGITGETDMEIVRNIYDYVIDKMEYTVAGKTDVGAAAALERGRGDCTEYSDLFTALCRAKEIPARVVSGYVASYDPARSKHNWIEVYLRDYGWVPFDPSSGDIRSDYFRNRAFSILRPAYVYFSNIRNDEVLNGYQFARFTYRGRRIKVTDSIEFKQPD
jgi:transglutaminase-like putative cysteine protease